MRWIVAVLTVAGLAGCVGDEPEPVQDMVPEPLPSGDVLAAGNLSFDSLTWAAQATIATGDTGPAPMAPAGAYLVEMRGTMHVTAGEGGIQVMDGLGYSSR